MGFFLNTHISVCTSKQNLDLSVIGINHWKAYQLLLNSKAAKLKLVKGFFFKGCAKAYTLNVSSLSCCYVSCHSTLPNFYYSQSKKVDPFCFSIAILVTARVSSWYLSLEAAEMQRVMPIV